MRDRLLGVLIALACRASAQTETPVIKVEVPTVSVDVIVTDRKGHHVPGLTAQDFKVSESGTAQEIAFFRAPVTTVPGTGVVPAIPNQTGTSQSTAPESSYQHTPQLITLVIDLGDLQFANLKDACKAAAQYVEKTLAGGNQIALYWVDSSLHLAVPFSADKQRLLEALEKLSKSVPSGRFTVTDRIHTEQKIDDLFTTIHPETEMGIDPQPTAGRPSDPMAKALQQEMNIMRSWLVIANTFQARAVFVALRALAVAYRDLPGRKSVVLFSEGFLHAPDAGAEMQAVIDAANRANMSLYVIDASGGSSGMTTGTRAPPDIGGRRKADAAFENGPGSVALGHDQFDWGTTLASDVHGDLGWIAEATGGFLVSNTNNLLAGIERVERDGSEFYTLVYHPTDRNYDGAFRKIKVALATGGYHLRYRLGYWAIPPGRDVMMTPAAAQLLGAIENGSRKSAFAPAVNAAISPSRDGGYAIPVSVSLPGNLVHFEKQNDGYVAGVTLLLVAHDSQGRLTAVHESYGHLRFSRKEREVFESKTFNVQGHLPIQRLEPLTVQAIVDFTSGAVGKSAAVKVDAAAADEGLLLTNLILSNRVEPSDCSADLTEPLCIKNVRVYMPSTSQFLASDKLTAYFSARGLVAERQTKKPALGVTFSLISGTHESLIKPERMMAVPGTSADSLMVLAEFSLKAVPPGEYTLRTQCKDTVQHAAATGQAMFLVNK